MKIIDNLPKIFSITLIFITAKSIFQFIFGTLINAPIHPFDSLNIINGTSYSMDHFISYFYYYLLYEIIIFGTVFYFWMFVLLFFLIKKFGNKISLQILYLLIIYIFAVQIFNNEKVDIYPVLIVILLGLLNWWMFKKWIK